MYTNSSMNELSKRIKNIDEYRKNNPGCDPNAYEMVEVLSDYNKIFCDVGKNGSVWANEEFKSIHREVRDFIDTRNEQFNQNGLKHAQESALYNYFNDTFPTLSTSGVSYNLADENVKKICAKACGINLYIQQQIRDNLASNSNNIIYNNLDELYILEANIKKAGLSPNALEALDDLRNENKIAYNKTPEQYKEAIKEYYKNKKLYLETKKEYENSKNDNSLSQDEKDKLYKYYYCAQEIHFGNLSDYTKDYREKERNLSDLVIEQK